MPGLAQLPGYGTNDGYDFSAEPAPVHLNGQGHITGSGPAIQLWDKRYVAAVYGILGNSSEQIVQGLWNQIQSYLKGKGITYE
jgi:hypothetical protein